MQRQDTPAERSVVPPLEPTQLELNFRSIEARLRRLEEYTVQNNQNTTSLSANAMQTYQMIQELRHQIIEQQQTINLLVASHVAVLRQLKVTLEVTAPAPAAPIPQQPVATTFAVPQTLYINTSGGSLAQQSFLATRIMPLQPTPTHAQTVTGGLSTATANPVTSASGFTPPAGPRI